MSLLDGKCALVCGVANEKSIGWAIARALHAEGARVALGCLPSLVRRGERLAAQLGGAPVVAMDVRQDDQVQAGVGGVGERFGGRLDILVHSIAYADIADLGGEFVGVSRQGWNTALEISAYSLVALARACRPLMQAAGGGSVMALTFIGGERVAPGYNVMGVAKAALEATVRYLAYDLGPAGIRVNAISAGPVETPSSMVVEAFQKSRDQVVRCSPMQRNIEAEDVARTAVYLASPLSAGVTGVVLPVDSGMHCLVPAVIEHRARHQAT